MYVINNMQSHFTKYIILAIASTTCAQAAAGFAFTNPTRLYGITVANSSDSHTVNTTGYLFDSLALARTNDQGTTAVKMDHESTLGINIYKSATLINLKADLASPRSLLTGGATLFRNSFLVDQQTTIRISYQVINKGDIDSAYGLRLFGSNGTTLINESIFDNQSDSITLSLAPGAYILEDFTTMFGLAEEQVGDWTISTTMSMMIVPTPTTLALLAPATLFATRRRRAK